MFCLGKTDEEGLIPGWEGLLIKLACVEAELNPGFSSVAMQAAYNLKMIFVRKHI